MAAHYERAGQSPPLTTLGQSVSAARRGSLITGKGARVFLLLAIPVALGYLCARRVLGRDSWAALWGDSLGFAIVLTVILVNGFYRQLGTTVIRGYTGLEVSLAAALAVELLAVAVLLWKAPEAPPKREIGPTWLTRALLGLSLLVVFYTNAQQIAFPDDDYWIHAPLQGLMRAGNFPPFNPFFSDIAMNGHYGRNLGIVSFSALSGCDVFMSQHLLTSGIQVLTLWIFFAAFTRSSASPQIGLLAATFVFFGINVGGRGGLVDTMQNNNAFVHLYLALLLGLMVDVWQKARPSTAVLAGLTLGGYAIVYETHFGLVFLTVAVLTPLFAVRKLITGKAALCALTALAISLPLAFTQGGPLTDILARRKEGRQHTQAENLSKGMQNQAQVVKITFPKKELFQILLETGEYQRVAHIYTLDTPLRRLHTPTTERGYAYIWSWDVLKLHFLPLYLFPLSLAVLWKRGSLAGHFMGAFGVVSFLTPALVHFGPIYESEYYRWEFAAGLGFTAALGLTLGHLVGLDKIDGRREIVWSGPSLHLSRRGLALLGVLLLTLLNSWASLSFVGGRLQQSMAGKPNEWLYFPSTKDWLARHQVLDFDPLDIKAATWLAAQVEPGDRLLANFSQENNFSILFESTLTGMTGARCVGHALPLEDEKIGTTPFRRAPAAVAFWETHRAEPLAQLQAKWLYYRDDHGRQLPSMAGVKVAHREEEGDRIRVIYEVDQSALPSLKTAEVPVSETSAKAALRGLPESFRGGRLVELELVSEKPSRGVLELSTVRRSDGLVSAPSENLHWRLEAGPKGVKVPFVPPYDQGKYELKADWFPDKGQAALAVQSPDIAVDFIEKLEKAKLGGFRLLDFPDSSKEWPSRTLLTPSVRLQSAFGPWPESDDVLACWAFYSAERKEFDLPPQVHMRRIRLGQERIELPLVTPAKPGLYRLALYVCPEQGRLLRFPAGTVTVSATVEGDRAR